jgi:hypothetical protein
LLAVFAEWISCVDEHPAVPRRQAPQRLLDISVEEAACLDYVLFAVPWPCANSEGRPWTESGFRASWRPIRVKLEQAGKIGPGLTMYGLRHTVAVILRELGCDERTIADALGQKTTEMARHYAEGADLKPKMQGVVANFDAELNRRRTKVVKPPL